MPGERYSRVNVPLPTVDPVENPAFATVTPTQRVTVPDNTSVATEPMNVSVPAYDSALMQMPSNAEIVAAARNKYEKTSNPFAAFAQGFANAQAIKSEKQREIDVAAEQMEKAEAEREKQIAFLQNVAPDKVAAVEAGMYSVQDAYTEYRREKAGVQPQRKFMIAPDGTGIWVDETNGTVEEAGNFGKDPEPMSAAGKLESDYRNHLITEEAYKAGLDELQKDGDGEATFNNTSSLRKEVQQLPSYKNFTQALPIYQSMAEAAGRDTKAADLNLVYGLGKIMDPTSVVREGEMVLVQNTASLPDWIQGAINTVNSKARLSPQTREALLTEAYGRMQGYKQAYEQDANSYGAIADRSGMMREDVLPNFPDFQPWKRQVAEGEVAKVSTVDEYNALPSGAKYIDPNGRQRTKQ